MEWLKISTELVRVQTDDIVFVQADGETTPTSTSSTANLTR